MPTLQPSYISRYLSVCLFRTLNGCPCYKRHTSWIGISLDLRISCPYENTNQYQHQYDSLLGHSATYFRRSRPPTQRCVLPPSRLIALMKAVMSAHFYETTWRYIPEDYNFHTRHRQNLKCYETSVPDIRGDTTSIPLGTGSFLTL